MRSQEAMSQHVTGAVQKLPCKAAAVLLVQFTRLLSANFESYDFSKKSLT
jgi:hypothetical protein